MASLEHTHFYERVGPRKTAKLWRCKHPDCTHTLRADLIEGKRSMCECGKRTFIIDAAAMQRRRPKCLMCRDTKEGRAAQSISNLLDVMDLDKETPIEPEGFTE